MAQEINFVEAFRNIEDRVFTQIKQYATPCLGPLCDTRITYAGYKCNSCGSGPNQGYLSRDFTLFSEVDSQFDSNSFSEDYISDASDKEKLFTEAANLGNLNLKIAAKQKELLDLQKVILTLNEIIQTEINDKFE
ncbi:MAG: hypothetical protein ABI462_03710 [Ignavibacteria bacterium]